MTSSYPTPKVSIGNQPPNQHHVKDGYKYDRRVTCAMVEDLLFDPVMAAKVLLGIQIPPHQELRILQAWTTHWTLDDSGFSTGKSFTYAVLSALRSILIAGRIGGILSGTFRQGKLIFAYYDRWAAISKIFRNCVKTQNGKLRLVHGQEVHEAHFRGTSTVRVLPPNFMQDSERIRSERWHDGYFDEWITFGNFKAFNKTIVARVTAVNHFDDCPVRQNHLHLSSTPDFVHHPAYRIVKQVQNNINAGNTNYGRFTSNYRHVPKTPKWQHLVNRKIIFSMQSMNPKGVVESEVDGLWTTDSLSYYSSAILDDLQLRQGIHIRIRRTHKDDTYIAAFDSARGQEGMKQAQGDDFSLSVLRIPFGETRAEFCFAVRRNNITAAQAAAIIHIYHQAFHFTLLGYDPGGGGMFVRDELRKTELEIMGKVEAVYPIVEMGDTSGTVGDVILVPIRRSTFQIAQLWGKMASDSVLVNRIHKNMRNVMETHQLVVPPEWPGWEKIGMTSRRLEIDQMRVMLEQAAGTSELERAWAETDLAMRQLILVDVERNDNGEPILDSHGMYKFKSKQKKDAAYSLIYAVLLKAAWDNLIAMGLVDGAGQAEDEGYCATSEI